MKKLTIIITLLFTATIYAQNPYLQKSDVSVKQEAEAITEKYNNQLSLTTKQFLLFQSKVEEYLIKSNEVKEKFEGRDKLDNLYLLQQQEIGDMGDILTRIQLDLYKEIRPKIQALASVEK